VSLVVIAEAEQEADDSAAWYDNADPGRGRHFLEAVNRAVKAARRMPRAFSLVVVSRDSREIRKVLVKKYPYTAFYQVRGADVVVLAIANQRRRPFYWRHRRAP
jgi:plasmid stabilization system protein ParE